MTIEFLWRVFRKYPAPLLAALASITAQARLIDANPSNYQTLLSELRPGDTLVLAPGFYNLLYLQNLRGTSTAWITIAGAQSPEGTEAAVITGNACCNTVEVVDSSYLAIEGLRIDSLNIDGVFGISAKDGLSNLVHDILIQGNVLVGQNASQETDGISTKTPTWNWTIRGNKIFGAGTGLYLGNSDGTDPFVAGVIENNLVEDCIGYDMEIKYQLPRPSVSGMPTGTSTTIIRNNVFIKGDQPSPDGDRPNVLVGGFPSSGPGMDDLYEFYGNFFDHNPRESLLQASGRVAIHDNVFVDGQYAAVVLQNQDLPLKLAYLYNNTVYTSLQGIFFGNAAETGDEVIGNLVFAGTPISGPIMHESANLTDTVANAVNYVNSPSFVVGEMNFFPLPGKVAGSTLNLAPFASEADYTLDFNGITKNKFTGAIVFRGAYAGTGTNPGWKLQAGLKPE